MKKRHKKSEIVWFFKALPARIDNRDVLTGDTFKLKTLLRHKLLTKRGTGRIYYICKQNTLLNSLTGGKKDLIHLVGIS